MIKRQIHPSVIISGYKTACKQGINFIKEHLALNTEDLGAEGLAKVAQTSMSSKLISGETDLFSSLCV